MSEINIQRTPEAPHLTPEISSDAVEHRSERVAVTTERAPDVQPVEIVPKPNVTPAPVAVHQPTNPLIKNIEDTMADGLADAYQAMDPKTQQEFKRVGEETASAISKLLSQSKIQVQKIVSLILRWLRIIPRVNPYYLEQQAKIKADAIVAMTHPPREGN